MPKFNNKIAKLTFWVLVALALFGTLDLISSQLNKQQYGSELDYGYPVEFIHQLGVLLFGDSTGKNIGILAYNIADFFGLWSLLAYLVWLSASEKSRSKRIEVHPIVVSYKPVIDRFNIIRSTKVYGKFALIVLNIIILLGIAYYFIRNGWNDSYATTDNVVTLFIVLIFAQLIYLPLYILLWGFSKIRK